jgi:hypothetical protein
MIAFSLTTGTLMALLAISEAFLLMVYWKKTSAYAAIGLTMPGVSTLSVFVTLRARESLPASLMQESPSEVVGTWGAGNNESNEHDSEVFGAILTLVSLLGILLSASAVTDFHNARDST